MNIADAKAECERWLAYLKRQQEKSVAMQKIAAARRAGTMDLQEAQIQIRALDSGVTVYDGARPADAVRTLLKATRTIA